MSISLTELYDTRTTRLKLQKEVDKLEQKEKDLTYALTKQLLDEDINELRVDGFKATMEAKESVNVTDWPQLIDFIKHTGYVDLLQRRVTESAVKARWLAGVDVPGAESLTKHVIKVIKDE